MPAPTLKVVDDTPELDQGEIDDNPVPAPKAIRTKLSAAAAPAPAATAAHDTAESSAPSLSSATMAISVARKSVMARLIILIRRLMQPGTIQSRGPRLCSAYKTVCAARTSAHAFRIAARESPTALTR